MRTPNWFPSPIFSTALEFKTVQLFSLHLNYVRELNDIFCLQRSKENTTLRRLYGYYKFTKAWRNDEEAYFKYFKIIQFIRHLWVNFEYYLIVLRPGQVSFFLELKLLSPSLCQYIVPKWPDEKIHREPFERRQHQHRNARVDRFYCVRCAVMLSAYWNSLGTISSITHCAGSLSVTCVPTTSATRTDGNEMKENKICICIYISSIYIYISFFVTA